MAQFRINAIYALAMLASAAFGAGLAVTPAHAQSKNAVALDSIIEVERTVTDATGASSSSYSNPANSMVVPGDVLRFTINYNNASDAPANALNVTNPIPSAVEFIRVEESWAVYSIDGGKTYGALESLTVSATAEDGSATTRAATPGDVTHIRWTLDRPLAPLEKGSLKFYGRVR